MDSPTRDRPSDDDLDDILRGTMNDEDIFDTSNIEAQVQARLPKKQKPVGPDVLGLDEEIKITKKRQPIPKLDGKLLASYAGIPKLRKMSKDRLKFKGKGHEVKFALKRYKI
jgi:replication fork protection complex subunit Csm3/Swi3